MAAKRGRPAKKKSATATQIKNREAAQALYGKREIGAILLFSLSIFLLFLVFIEGQNVWLWMHNTMFGLFGVCAYVLPVLLGLVSILCALDKLYGHVGAKIIETCFLVVFIGAAIDIFGKHVDGQGFGEHLTYAFNNGKSIKGGGFVGALFGHPLYILFGKQGAGVFICLLIFVFLMLITGTTLLGLFRALAKPVKSIEKQANDAFAAKMLKTEEENPADKKPAPFQFDIPVDDIPEERTPVKETLNEKQKKVIETYHELEEEKEAIEAVVKKVETKETAIAVAEPETKKTEVAITSRTDSGRNTGALIIDEEEGYRYPPISLLSASTRKLDSYDVKEMENTATRLVDVLRSFGVETRVVDISQGPTVTRYELQPSAGVKISKITGLADDIALNLATAGVRIEAPIPNKAAVGIEVPNKNTIPVGVREIIESKAFATAKSKLTVALGKDIGGNVVVADIAKMPHGLIAGATGSGKSVCINSIIISLLYKASPDEVKILMIDPKVVELGIYNGIPHLLVPVVTDPRKAAGALNWAVLEMERRYKMFAENNVRDLTGYNRLAKQNDQLTKMPHIVIIIDELADLMMTAPSEVEDSICRISQKARAAGMHLIIATQRPSVDVVTGLIKANIPTRIAFAVSSQVDSRTILDMAGAEKLLGRGDMLFSPVGSNKPTRVQGCFVSDTEVETVVDYIKGGHSTDYDEAVMDEIEKQAVKEKESKSNNHSDDDGEEDEMLQQAIDCVVEAGQASTSLLQRRLKLGYARAARIIDEMEARGIVGPYEGSKPRQVLITKAQLLEKRAGEE